MSIKKFHSFSEEMEEEEALLLVSYPKKALLSSLFSHMVFETPPFHSLQPGAAEETKHSSPNSAWAVKVSPHPSPPPRTSFAIHHRLELNTIFPTYHFQDQKIELFPPIPGVSFLFSPPLTFRGGP